MSSPRALPLLSTLLILVASLARLGPSAGRLPERVASHFDGAGVANGFQSRSGFIWTCVLFELGIFALFAILPNLLHAMPTRLINLPHRDYWLHEDRKAQSLARAAALLDWFGLATLLLMAATFELVLRANLRQGDLDSHAMWFLLAAYFAFSASWIFRFLRAFPAPPA